MTKSPSFSHKQRPGSPAKGQESFAPRQPDLFADDRGSPRQFVDLDLNLEIIAAAKQSLRLARERGLSVERICDRMNQMLPADRHVTSRQVYGWCAQSREDRRFPAEYIPSFTVATECSAILRLLAGSVGFELVDEREACATRLGENIIQRSRLAREEKELKRRLGGS